MPFNIFKTTADFITNAQPFWETNPITSNLQWGLATRGFNLPNNEIMIGGPDWFGLQTEAGRPFILVATHPLSAQLVTEIKSHYPHINGVIGTTKLGRSFTQYYAPATYQEQMAMHIYALPRTRRTAVLSAKDHPPQNSASFRLATMADLDLLTIWQEDFLSAVKQIGGAVDFRARTLEMIEQQQLFVYCLNKSIVTMAASTRRVGGVAVINYVFTPNKLRGKGYASTCVGQLCDLLLQDYEHCMLYADKNNPASNAVYLKLGFEVVGQGVEILFNANSPADH